jgi:ubiquitin C-terminal hydrolase
MFQNPLSKILSFFYWDLLRNLFFPNKETQLQRYYAPYNFKQIIGKMNPLFYGNQASDSKDLLFFLIETLHDELNIINMNNNMNNNNFFNMKMDNPYLVFQLFMKEFLSKNNSIITKLFYGFNESCLKCLNCNRIKYSFQSFNITIIPLIKAYHYKLKKIKKYGKNNNKILNIYDAFESLSEKDYFEGDNMIYCNDCKKLCKALHQQFIFRTPTILIVVLNRGKANLDYQGDFEFYSELDLSNYVYDKNCVKKYFLIGIISHIGESGSSGHFISYCRNQPNTLFYCYNDASVFQLKNNDDAYGNKIINEKRTPYILFYKVYN